MAFVYDDAKHEYWLSGQRLPSVTELISPLVDFSMVPEDRLEFARDRGTAVHRACHLDDIGDLDESTVDPENVLPYLKGWRKFVRQYECVFTVLEEPMCHPTMRYGGTPDRAGVVKINGIACSATIDIKTVAKVGPVVGVQLTGYDLMLAARGYPEADVLMSVQLTRDGNFVARQHKREAPMFLSLLTLHNWKARHGIH